MARQKGLRQRILMADTVGAVEALLQEGKGFRKPSKKTTRGWANAAKRRVGELSEATK